MSTGNAGAAIGLDNTVKIDPIGAFVQRVGPTTVVDSQNGNPNPTTANEYTGASGSAQFDYNALGEDIGFVVQGATQGANVTAKTAQWVQLGVGGLTNEQTRANIVDGVATYDVAGTYDVFATLKLNRTLPAGTYCWAFER